MTVSKANRNDGGGINTGGRSVVTGNSANNSTGGDGIETGPGCTVIGNSANDNAGYGLRLGGRAGYANNVLDHNNGEPRGVRFNQVFDGVSMGTNICGGYPNCP